MQTHTLQRNTKRTKARQVGRGGKRGKTSGRGTKGQKARAGRKLRPEIRDRIKKLPKLRGRGIHPNKTVGHNAVAVNLNVLDKNFSNGDVVSPKTLVDKKLVKKLSGKPPVIKILGNGEISKKLKINGCLISKTALVKLKASGSEVA